MSPKPPKRGPPTTSPSLSRRQSLERGSGRPCSRARHCDPSERYLLGELEIDHFERRVTLSARSCGGWTLTHPPSGQVDRRRPIASTSKSRGGNGSRSCSSIRCKATLTATASTTSPATTQPASMIAVSGLRGRRSRRPLTCLMSEVAFAFAAALLAGALLLDARLGLPSGAVGFRVEASGWLLGYLLVAFSDGNGARCAASVKRRV